jgi:hypothetical protein
MQAGNGSQSGVIKAFWNNNSSSGSGGSNGSSNGSLYSRRCSLEASELSLLVPPVPELTAAGSPTADFRSWDLSAGHHSSSNSSEHSSIGDGRRELSSPTPSLDIFLRALGGSESEKENDIIDDMMDEMMSEILEGTESDPQAPWDSSESEVGSVCDPEAGAAADAADNRIEAAAALDTLAVLTGSSGSSSGSSWYSWGGVVDTVSSWFAADSPPLSDSSTNSNCSTADTWLLMLP